MQTVKWNGLSGLTSPVTKMEKQCGQRFCGKEHGEKWFDGRETIIKSGGSEADPSLVK
jgi:hypothetical protein